MQILNEIDQLWESDFKGIYNGSKKKRKTLGRTFKILVVFNERGFSRLPQEACPFDNPEEKSSYRKYRSLWYGINSCPVEEKHVILFPSEHREWPTEEDFEDILAFTSETHYTCSLNLRDSGASISNHVHFQGVREDFPCFTDERILSVRNDETIIYRLSTPYHAALVHTNSSQRKRVSRIANLRKPYNVILKSQNGRDYIFVYARKGIFSRGLDGFKIGAPEMARLFYAKNNQQYEDWTYTDLLGALQEVSPRKERAQSLFNKEISDLVMKK